MFHEGRPWLQEVGRGDCERGRVGCISGGGKSSVIYIARGNEEGGGSWQDTPRIPDQLKGALLPLPPPRWQWLCIVVIVGWIVTVLFLWTCKRPSPRATPQGLSCYETILHTIDAAPSLCIHADRLLLESLSGTMEECGGMAYSAIW
jgi:hypothetical protein